jgi:hypothetical protein
MSAGNILALWNSITGKQDVARLDTTTGGLIIRAYQSFIGSANVAKTANYTVGTVATDVIGTVFTNRGAAGAVTFTLPSPTSGAYYFFASIADQNVTISAGAGLGITVNNAAAASIAFSTSSQKIGSFAVAIADGTSWLLINLGTNTATVA